MKPFIFLFIISILLGCSSQHLTLSNEISNKVDLRLDGFYYQTTENESYKSGYLKVLKYRYNSSILFFFHDNTYVATSISSEKDDLASILEAYNNFIVSNKNNNFNDIYRPGVFIVKNNELILQFFAIRPGFHKDKTIKNYYKIVGDSHLEFYKNECVWCSKEDPLYNNNSKLYSSTVYNFYEYNNKPDSSKIWFRKESWFKR